MMRLANHFRGVAVKRLSAVEAHPTKSNQHEFNGVSSLKTILGSDRACIPTRFLYMTDDDSVLSADGTCTWYDARERHLTRTEYRLYFPSNEIMSMAEDTDIAFFCLRNDGTLLIIIAAAASTPDNQLQWLFDTWIPLHDSKFVSGPLFRMDDDLGFAGRYILEEIGIEPEEDSDDGLLHDMLERFGGEYPPTAIFSEYSRQTIERVNPLDDPDEALLRWFDQEERLFRIYEKHLVSKRLRQGFGEDGEDVDAFIKYSLSVHNRRKSRSGYALENHLERIFSMYRLDFSAQCRTEKRKTPDFVFPGCEEYHSTETDPESLFMLGVKTTCKDRWRQVLSEAERITNKHLLTLEPGISHHQTDEMKNDSLQLVIPEPIQDSYTPDQRQWLMSVSEFIGLVRED